jgi:MFS family permease
MGFAASVFDGDPENMVRAMVVLRVIQGMGAAMSTTCIFAILTDAFPQNKGAVIGAANACDGAGWAVGPPVGGFLYVAGGFSLPFYVVGPMPLVLLALQLAVFPKIGAPPMSPRSAAAADSANGDEDGPSVYDGEVEAERIGAAEVFRRARALLNAPMLMTMAAGAVFTSKWGMFDVTFTPWAVAEFGFTIREVSIYFSIPGIFPGECSAFSIDEKNVDGKNGKNLPLPSAISIKHSGIVRWDSDGVFVHLAFRRNGGRQSRPQETPHRLRFRCDFPRIL